MFRRYFLITIMLIFTVHALMIQNHLVHYRKGESNFFSSRARAQEAFCSTANIALLGSSISGRIPGHVNGAGELANYSADGYTFAQGLKWLEMPRNRHYHTVIIESNTIDGAEFGDSLKLASWEILGARVKPLSASARPSSIIYSALISSSDTSVGGKNFHFINYQVEFGSSFHQRNWVALEYHHNVLGKLSEIKKTGANIAFVEYPAGQRSLQTYSQRLPFIEWLCNNLNAKFYDCSSLEKEQHINLTDGVHMDQNGAINFFYAIKEHQF
jgi:hypothetical protein